MHAIMGYADEASKWSGCSNDDLNAYYEDLMKDAETLGPRWGWCLDKVGNDTDAEDPADEVCTNIKNDDFCERKASRCPRSTGIRRKCERLVVAARVLLAILE